MRNELSLGWYRAFSSCVRMREGVRETESGENRKERRAISAWGRIGIKGGFAGGDQVPESSAYLYLARNRLYAHMI